MGVRSKGQTLSCSHYCATAACSCLQVVESLLHIISTNFYQSIRQAAKKITGSIQALTDKDSSGIASVTLTTAPGCARDAEGSARLEFVINRDNITKEGVSTGSGRKLLHTPCSATDGTQVSSCLR